MDLILRNARIAGAEERPPVDIGIGIDPGRIISIESDLTVDGREIEVGGRLVTPGFIETQIHHIQSANTISDASRTRDHSSRISWKVNRRSRRAKLPAANTA